MVVVGQKVAVIGDTAACHGVSARPRSEQDCFEQRVLLGVLLHCGALKAVDGRDTDVVQNHFLRIALAQCVMRLKRKDRMRARLGSAGLGNAAHVHAVDVEGHVPQLDAAMCVIVGGVCAVSASLDRGGKLRSVAIAIAIGNVHGHRLHVSERLLRLMLDGLVVKLFLALLHGPLKLPSEDGDVVVALQAIAVGENMDGKLCCRHPKAAIGHGGEPDRKAASTPSELLRRLLPLACRLQGRLVRSRLASINKVGFLLRLLSLQAVHAIGHAFEQRREGLHGFALVLRDVEVHGSGLPERFSET